MEIHEGASDPQVPQYPCQYRKGVQDSRASHHSTESSMVHGVVSRGGRLQLSHLQPAQAGTYTCVAENAQAEARKDFVVSVLGVSALYMTPSLPHPSSPCYWQALIMARITVPPQIQDSGMAQEHNVLERQEIRLHCEAEGQPPPDITWLKDGGPLDQHAGPHLR